MNATGQSPELNGMRLISRAEIQIKSNYCGFKYHDESMFYTPFFGITERSLTRFRMVTAAFHWLVLLLRSREVERLPMFCYLTNLVYFCCALYYTIAAYNSTIVNNSLCGADKPAPPVFRMDRVCYEGLNNKIKPHFVAQWLLHSMVINLSLLVSILYFLLIYDPNIDVLGLTNISRHIFNSVLILVELTFNSIAIKFHHIIWSVTFALLYTCYTLIFWYYVSPPENYIYTMVDWNKPTNAIRLIFILLVASVITKLLLVGFWRFKLRLLGVSESQQRNPFLV